MKRLILIHHEHRIVALLLVATALMACSKKDEAKTAEVDASTAATPPAVATPAKFDRKYAGTVGETAKATMHLVRDEERVSGEYAYTSVGRSIALTGTAAPDGSIALQESVAGKSTGQLKGQLANDGTFSGTWTNAEGQKPLPFHFEESSGAVVPPVMPLPAVAAKGKPVEPATNDEAGSALVKVAKANGVTVDAATAAKDFDGVATSEYAKDGAARRTAFGKKYGLDIYSGMVSLYTSDVNNDGVPDVVIVETNSVGLHNDDVAAVFLGRSEQVVKSKLPEIKQLEKTATNFSIAIDPEGTVMYFTDAGVANGKVHRILWTGKTAKQL